MSGVYYPTGTIMFLAGVEPEWDWMECDGRSLDGTKAKYAALFAVIGTKFGGAGISDFRLPDLRGRSVSGVKATPTGTGLDGPIGSWTGSTSVLLTNPEVGTPGHAHSGDDPGHTHTPSFSAHAHDIYNQGVNAGYVFKNTDRGTTTNSYFATGNFYDSAAAAAVVSIGSGAVPSFDVANAASANPSEPHENRQPSIALTGVIHL